MHKLNCDKLIILFKEVRRAIKGFRIKTLFYGFYEVKFQRIYQVMNQANSILTQVHLYKTEIQTACTISNIE